MSKVTIPKIEYEFLKKRATAYERVLKVAQDELYVPPPTRSREEVLRAFRGTRRYSRQFLESVAKGLRRSSYFK
ncbi:MAG: hypothetical protein Q8P52_00870 [bacterium]|nr:hypothetical protein [bacterium]